MGRKNIKIEFRYDGSGYYGFQRQPNKITVQGEIERILRIVTKEEINLISAGRTDRGVHANHQVSNFYTSSNIPIEKYKYLLTRALPNDIDILSVEEVDEKFNARHNAKMREYIYIISWEKNPFEARYCKFVKEKIDSEKLERIFFDFEGIHDFKNFRLNDCASKVTIREIYQIEVKHFGENKIKIYIKGSAFLKSQVRIMIGTALEIYYGRLAENHIRLMLNDFTKKYKKNLVEPEGLYLNRIEY
ncbi:tRNA pseudouridine(38-40) synthase TruA [Fusobacterium simiae]|uniref:tRNA pseudouridine(38-40) synthase TruA n=1 Tax=Fusobacterium TaxID=848 RepID=UPI0003F56EAA|nr:MULTISPECIES: tRNA pseudouridine(38-40) synthase TruA [Fusobacterium]MDC7954384.1 tRNA pseudouridine(38-40) synthase TruA [Fusobacterium simiae]